MKRLIIVAIVLSAFVAAGCGSGSKEAVKDTSVTSSQKPGSDFTPPAVSSGKNDLWLQQSNKQLAKIPVEGFAYKSSDVPAQRWDRWAKVSAPVVKKVLDNMPAGYVLQVTGHTDARGPEQPEGDKPGNIKLSTDRAKEVHAALRRQGITSDKMTFKGIGSSDPKKGINPRSAKQRRVTFVVIPE